VLDLGHGHPVVCLHGVPASSFLYRKLIVELAAGFSSACVALKLLFGRAKTCRRLRQCLMTPGTHGIFQC